MHGLRERGGRFEGYWAAPPRHGRFGRGGGRGHGHGGDGEGFRIGRMLAHGDLKLLALALIAEQPRHGYELIKLIEEKTSNSYSPSPGVIYPTLTFLEEAGFVISESEGAKKRYAITEEGRTYLEENREIADMALKRLEAVGKRMAQRRDWERFADDGKGLPPLVAAALNNLRSVSAKRLEADADAETAIVEILARAAKDVRGS
jgi:DNA-binding PadR family transcriptional regulator